MDLDQDRQVDMVVASEASGTLAVIWGSNEGQRGRGTMWSVAPGIAGLAVADVDGDDRLDLVTTVPGEQMVVAFLAQSGRTFARAPAVTVGPSPRTVIAADLDGAGTVELVTVHGGEDSISVIRDLATETRIPVGPGPRDVAAGDLDQDGDLDLGIALTEHNAVQVLLGDGSGGFTSGPLHPVGAGPSALVAADFDGDGALDLASADALGNSTTVLFGDGTAGLRKTSTWPAASEPGAILAIQDDELPDLIVWSRQSETVARIDPRTGSTVTGTASDGVSAVAVADVDDDGREDLVFAGTATGALGIARLGSGVALAPLWERRPIQAAFPLDLSGDGADDLLALGPEGASTIWTSAGGELGGPTLAFERPVIGAAAGDVDGDSQREIVVWSLSELKLFHRDGDEWEMRASAKMPKPIKAVLLGVTSEVERSDVLVLRSESGTTAVLERFRHDVDDGLRLVDTQELSGQITSMSAVDVDANPWLDLLLGQAGTLGILPNVGTGEARRSISIGPMVFTAVAVSTRSEAGEVVALACSGEETVAVMDLLGEYPRVERLADFGCDQAISADLDADGVPDFLTLRRISSGDEGAGRVLILPWLSDGDGWTEQASQSVSTRSVAAFARMDGDAIPDLLLFDSREYTRAFQITQKPGLRASSQAHYSLEDVALGDLNGDGVLDLFAYGRGLGVALGDEHGEFQPFALRSLEIERPDVEAVLAAELADLDGDGADEVWAGVREATRWGSQIVALPWHDTTAQDAPAIVQPFIELHLRSGDLDRDGALDLLVLGRASQNGVSFLRGLGDGSFDPPEPGRSALSPWRADHVRLADMDGDHCLDLMILDSAGVARSAGRCDGGFTSWYPWSQVQNARTVDYGDVDRDGIVDLLFVASGGELALQRGAGAAAGNDLMVLESEISAAVVQDLDDEAGLEVIASGVAPNRSPRSSEILVTDGADGSFTFRRGTLSAPPALRLVVEDADGDGDRDIVLIGEGELTIVRQIP